MENSIVNPTRLLLLLSFYYLPNTFIHIVPSRFESINDPSLLYCKLKEYFKHKGISLKLIFLTLDSLSEKQKDKLKQKLNIKTDDDLKSISFIITDENGRIKTINKNEENFVSSRRFIEGITRISSLDDLNLIFNRLPEETIHIISNNKNSSVKKIINNFYENSSLFTQNTFNFINYSPSYYNNTNSIIKKDEIIFLFSPKFYNFNNECEEKNEENNHSYLYLYDLKHRKLEQLSNLNKKELLIKRMNQNEEFLLGYKYKISEGKNLNEELENVKNISKYLIDPDDKIQVQNELELKNLDNTRNFLNKQLYFVKRNYYTDNPNLASYYKLKYVDERAKTVFVYLNKANLSQNNLNPIDVTNLFQRSFHRNSNNEKIKYKYIITSNEMIAKIFNIIPKSKENITIRFIDYNKVVYYNENPLNGNYKLMQYDDSLLSKNNLNKNLLFYYKSSYNKPILNEEDFRRTLNEFLSEDTDLIKKFPHFLESVELKLTSSNNSINDELNENVLTHTQKPNTLEMVNSVNFENNFLRRPGKKILLCVSDNGVGCIKLKFIIEKYLLSNQSENLNTNRKIEFFLYDIANENLHLRKIRKGPLLILYDDSKILEEIDINKISENYPSYENAVIDQINKLLYS